jgi:hypothetical protein
MSAGLVHAENTVLVVWAFIIQEWAPGGRHAGTQDTANRGVKSFPVILNGDSSISSRSLSIRCVAPPSMQLLVSAREGHSLTV